MSAEDHPAMELTRDPITGTWGFVCREHGILRTGLTERHAFNVEAKHLREDHPDAFAGAINLTELAAHVWVHSGKDPSLWDLWLRVTGLSQDDAKTFGAACLDTTPDNPVTAAVAPF